MTLGILAQMCGDDLKTWNSFYVEITLEDLIKQLLDGTHVMFPCAHETMVKGGCQAKAKGTATLYIVER